MRVVLSALPFFALAAEAGPLTQAQVTKIVNQVKLVDPVKGSRPALLQDVVKDEVALETGLKSRSELLFQDNTLTRLGPETYFSFRSGTREMSLKQGTMLLQVPKGLGGARIHSASVTASITGTTIMMEYVPNKDIKVLVLEGSLRLSNKGLLGDSIVLHPGQMVIMPPKVSKIPDPVTVDLKKVLKTSKLVNMSSGGKKGKDKPLPSLALIENEAAQQQQSKDKHQLIDTNLVIMGKGTDVQLTSAQVVQQVSQRTDTVKTSVTDTLPPPGPAPAGDIGEAPRIEVSDDGKKTEERYGEDDRLTTPLVINHPQDFTQNGGVGSVKIRSNDTVTVNTTMKVSDPTSGNHAGEINIDTNKASGTAISITSSAQLLALLAAAPAPGAGGKIIFKSAGGAVDVNGGTLQADRGTIDMRNNGDAGSVSLNNATLNASTIKVGALGNNGTLNVGGGTISADTIIRLYAGGSNGTVNFTDDVTLNGNSVKTIAGNTVTIFDGKVVTVNGPAPANVYTNHPNYSGFGGNGSTTGTFAGQGAITNPLNGKPGF